jgi:hypothetical protein
VNLSSVRGLGLWCLTPLSTTIQIYLGGQFSWYKKPEFPEKTTDVSQVTETLHSQDIKEACHNEYLLYGENF